jgi:hypothetical protein
MTFAQAVIEVLREASEPLTTNEVADAVLRSKPVDSPGKTPRATISAAMYVMSKSPNNPGVRRLAEPGPTRAKRGSVRWVWRP